MTFQNLGNGVNGEKVGDQQLNIFQKNLSANLLPVDPKISNISSLRGGTTKQSQGKKEILI